MIKVYTKWKQKEMVLAGKIHDSKSQFVLYPQMHHFHSMRTQEPPEFFHTLLMHGCKGKLVINILSMVYSYQKSIKHKQQATQKHRRNTFKERMVGLSDRHKIKEHSD